MLDAVLADGEVSEQQRHQLSQFREIHRLSEAQHAEMLSGLGWTASQCAKALA